MYYILEPMKARICFIMIILKLENKLNSIDKSIYWLAQETGVSYPTLFKIYKGKTTSISFDVLDKICKTLDCNLTDIIDYVPNK